MLVAAVPPKLTLVWPTRKFVPVTVTLASPVNAGPAFGLQGLTARVGAAKYVNRFGPVTKPPGVVTTTLTRPATWRGASQVRLRPLSATETLVAAVPPKVTLVWPGAKAVPVMATPTRPPSGPAAGCTGGAPVRVGIG